MVCKTFGPCCDAGMNLSSMDTKPALQHYPSLCHYLITSVTNRFMEEMVFIDEECVLQVTGFPEII